MDTIHFKAYGSGPPVMLLHGFCEAHEIRNSWAEIIAKTSKVYAINLPGFGKSPLLQSTFGLKKVAAKVIDRISVKRIAAPKFLWATH